MFCKILLTTPYAEDRMNRRPRTLFFADRKVQGSLLSRTAKYWGFCLFAVSLMLICWEFYAGPRRSFGVMLVDLVQRYGPALLASLVVLPMVMMDLVRFSNRFVEPAMRLREALRTLAEGGTIQPLHFRDGDYWREMAVDVNRVAGRLFTAEKHISPPTEVMPEPVETNKA